MIVFKDEIVLSKGQGYVKGEDHDAEVERLRRLLQRWVDAWRQDDHRAVLLIDRDTRAALDEEEKGDQ